MGRLLVLLGLLAGPAHALTLLTAGKAAVVHDGRLTLRVGRDAALAALPAPACPAVSSVRIAFSRTGGDFVDLGEIDLPCAGWRSTRRGWRWRGDGAFPSIAIGRRGLLVRAAADGVAGPLAWLETWITIAGERHLVRVQDFRRNDADRIVSRRPSASAAAGEAAFWDTVWGDAPRSDEALRLLERAVRASPRDGRSQFLLGMLHLHRSTVACADFDLAALCDDAAAEGAAAQAPLDRAAELLARDSRVPGFRAAATFANGVVRGDAAAQAAGLAQIDAAVAANPLFNAFDLFTVVAPVTPGASAYYQERVLPLVDLVFSDPGCIQTLPEICHNAGMAPHNFEGTLLLLGDIYAKGGRLADARQWYGLAQASGAASGYRHQAIADDRVATAGERVARYLDDDPGNDPPLLGGGAGTCRYCHQK